MSSSLKLSTLSGAKKTKTVAASKRKDACKPISEEEVLKKGTITPTDVCNLETYTKGTLYKYNFCIINVLNGKNALFTPKGYLCSPSDNIYDIEFTRFKIRDMENGNVLFEIVKSPTPAGAQSKANGESKSSSESARRSPEASIATISDDGRFSNCGRHVRYQFTSNFLKLKTVGATYVSFFKENFGWFCESLNWLFFAELSLKSVAKRLKTSVWLNATFFVTHYWKHSILTLASAFLTAQTLANIFTTFPCCLLSYVSREYSCVILMVLQLFTLFTFV